MCSLHISEKQRRRAQKWHIPQGRAPNAAIQRCSSFIWKYQISLLAPWLATFGVAALRSDTCEQALNDSPCRKVVDDTLRWGRKQTGY